MTEIDGGGFWGKVLGGACIVVGGVTGQLYMVEAGVFIYMASC